MSFPNNTSEVSTPNVSRPSLSPIESEELSAWIAITLTISAIGSVANITVLIATWPKRSAKSALNLQIFHFVFLNLIICLITVPASVSLVVAKLYGYPVWPHSCNYLYLPYMVFPTLVNWCDAGLAVNRVIALYFPLKYRAWNSKRVSIIMMAGYWIICLAFVVPAAFGVDGAKIQANPLGLCVMVPKGLYGKCFSAILLYIPYLITGVGVVLIVVKSVSLVRERRRVFQQAENNRRSRAIDRRLNLARMLLLTFLWTTVCMVPGVVIVYGMPNLYVTHPLISLWIRTITVCQYGFTPVRENEYCKE